MNRRPPDAAFADSRLAPLYDAFDDDRSDLHVYCGILAELGARRVLDVGCGTGSLAVLLAADGVEVTGLDPAAASLAVARAKPGADLVRWIEGYPTDLPALGADAAVMTGNVAQVFLDDDEWAETLRAIRAALRPGGHLVFETRRPEYRAWEEWAADTKPVVREVPGVGLVEERREFVEVALPFVSFGGTSRFPDGAVLASNSTLRFRSRAEVESSLSAAGYRVADVREAPDRPGREYVFLTESNH
ncbi:MAG: class I SAM-dependent methyltransferase [Marmoricola sp.]